MKIGSVELETDPAQALKEFQPPCTAPIHCPRPKRPIFQTARVRAMIMRKQAIALEQLGEYAQAVPLFEQALAISQRVATQDTKDLRALFDVVTVLDDEASYEDAANPVLAAKPGRPATRT